jgi:hypothetical protein
MPTSRSPAEVQPPLCAVRRHLAPRRRAPRRSVRGEPRQAEAHARSRAHRGGEAPCRSRLRGAAPLARRIDRREGEPDCEIARRGARSCGARCARWRKRRRNVELDYQRKLDAERRKIEDRAGAAALEELARREAQWKAQLASAQREAADLKRKLEQGSQQLQGEALELSLESLLRSAFPLDEILPVAKGINGADLVQHVRSASGLRCGAILWEAKQTKAVAARLAAEAQASAAGNGRRGRGPRHRGDAEGGNGAVPARIRRLDRALRRGAAARRSAARRADRDAAPAPGESRPQRESRAALQLSMQPANSRSA